MTSDQTFARSLHDLGAAAWFGGALMGVVGLQGAATAMPDDDGVSVADIGWQRWRPWKTAAIATHMAGSLPLLWGNKGRLATQRGAMATNLAKTGVFVAALGADLYAASLGRRVAQHRSATAEVALESSGDGTSADALINRDPSTDTAGDLELEDTQRRLRVVQWVVPALTGLNIVLAAKMGEQQRPTNLLSGLVERLDLRT
jgi:hypothetical protein